MRTTRQRKDNMQYLWIFPALILYTFICGLIIHLIADRHNRKKRRVRHTK